MYLSNAHSAKGTQPLALGIDSGSKREGSAVKLEVHPYLSTQAGAVAWVKEAVEVRCHMRGPEKIQKNSVLAVTLL